MLIRLALVNTKFSQLLDDFKPRQQEEPLQCFHLRKELTQGLFQRITSKTFYQKKHQEQVLINLNCLMQADDGQSHEMNDLEGLKGRQI